MKNRSLKPTTSQSHGVHRFVFEIKVARLQGPVFTSIVCNVRKSCVLPFSAGALGCCQQSNRNHVWIDWYTNCDEPVIQRAPVNALNIQRMESRVYCCCVNRFFSGRGKCSLREPSGWFLAHNGIEVMLLTSICPMRPLLSHYGRREPARTLTEVWWRVW